MEKREKGKKNGRFYNGRAVEKRCAVYSQSGIVSLPIVAFGIARRRRDEEEDRADVVIVGNWESLLFPSKGNGVHQTNEERAIVKVSRGHDDSDR